MTLHATDINKDIPIPLYYQISQLIRRRIESGEWKVGDQIPTEKQFKETYQVSRATIRQAISELVYDHLLERRRGKGTIVIRSRLEETLHDAVTFTREIMNRGMVPESRILDFKLIQASNDLAERLQTEPGDELVAMVRLRYVNGKPVCVENWYASHARFPNMKRDFFGEQGIEQSTYYMLQKRFGAQIRNSTETISPVALEQDDAELLNVPINTPALRRTRVAYLADGLPALYARGRYIIKLIINQPKLNSLGSITEQQLNS